MTATVSQKRAAFRALHGQGCFVLPNPWDVGSARLFAHLGFAALASTSSGFAWTTGRPDYGVSRDDVLAHLAALCEATDLPVNADFESGFAADPEGVAASVALAVDTGVAGLSVEDRRVDAVGTLYDLPEALERLRAARAAIDRSGADVLLVARTEGVLTGGKPSDAIDRLVAFADAGADCLYAPGIGMPGLSTLDDVAALVRAVAPRPVNVLVARPGVPMAALADLGVRRISIGGALALVGWGAVVDAATRLKDGDFDALAAAMPGAELNRMFGAAAGR
ncbi:MAG TPA: isocitrate lyase/phosphoenolpyruvate mutase family protein [Sphingomonas sp.]|nr:isocitrate lyase/phosphoenolpyruvate mutase family protein [Sphingomonas sp.]